MILLNALYIVRAAERIRDDFRFCVNRPGYWGDGKHPDVDLHSSNIISTYLFDYFDETYDNGDYRYATSYHNRLKFFQNQVMYYMEEVNLPWHSYNNGGIFMIEQQFAYNPSILEVGA